MQDKKLPKNYYDNLNKILIATLLGATHWLESKVKTNADMTALAEKIISMFVWYAPEEVENPNDTFINVYDALVKAGIQSIKRTDLIKALIGSEIIPSR